MNDSTRSGSGSSNMNQEVTAIVPNEFVESIKSKRSDLWKDLNNGQQTKGTNFTTFKGISSKVVEELDHYSQTA